MYKHTVDVKYFVNRYVTGHTESGVRRDTGNETLPSHQRERDYRTLVPVISVLDRIPGSGKDQETVVVHRFPEGRDG